MSSKRPQYWKPEDEQISDKDKFVSKMKKDPFIPIGFAGLLGAIGYGVYAYRTRGPAMTTSRYLMRLRVIAQSMVVGSIVVGVGVSQFGAKDKQ
ncbi:HIG1 domain family member 1A, mitochondrial-like [Clytia hemisphaerica]|uniref:HIG1 domain family member 1A, mitochondrial-like n=1 Tax=Clytia hemisphaerica TaxID=252671 RepID=UPI0034D75AAD